MSLLDQLLSLVGVIPPFALLWWIERSAARDDEAAPAWRYRVLAAGGLISVPVLAVGRRLLPILASAPEPLHTLFDAFIVAAALEESFKIACVLALTLGRLAPRSRGDALRYAIHASMGFALVENIAALVQQSDFETFTHTFWLRTYIALSMHLAAGALFGYAWARRRFDGHWLGGAGGAALAILLHGTFDTLLLGIERWFRDAFLWRAIFAAAALILPMAGFVLTLVLLHHLHVLDTKPRKP